MPRQASAAGARGRHLGLWVHARPWAAGALEARDCLWVGRARARQGGGGGRGFCVEGEGARGREWMEGARLAVRRGGMGRGRSRPSGFAVGKKRLSHS